MRAELELLELSPEDLGDFREELETLIAEEGASKGVIEASVKRELALVDERLARTTDAVIEGLIDKETFNERKAGLLAQRIGLAERLETGKDAASWRNLAEMLGRGNVALQSYILADDPEKRKILKSITSDLFAHQKNVEFPMLSPFTELREWVKSEKCALAGGAARTLRREKVREFLLTLVQPSGLELARGQQAPASALVNGLAQPGSEHATAVST